MKKVLLALFLMSGFVSAGFSITDFKITDESGHTQSSIDSPNLELDIPTGSVQQYKINATELKTGTTVFFKNTSGGNILMRFDAGATSNNQDGSTSKSQIIYQVGSQNDFSNSDYYALSSCEVDKSPDNRPTRSFFIINNNETKWLKFSMRDCETGAINSTGKVNLQTTLLAIRTQMSDNSVDSKGQNGSSTDRGLPTVIIEQEAIRDLSTKSITGKEEFLCGTKV